MSQQEEKKINIKICGIKNVEEVALINQFPIQYAGFIFAKSPRQVTLETAVQLRQALRADIKVVGVFVNEDIETVLAYSRAVPLDVVQLHGQETQDYCEQIGVSVWKSMGVSEQGVDNSLDKYKNCEAILLDTKHQGQSGGTGKTFDWSIAKALTKDYKIVLAGGLKPENVYEAATKVMPWCLDINSGVEVDGIKDNTKLQAVFQQLKEVL